MRRVFALAATTWLGCVAISPATTSPPPPATDSGDESRTAEEDLRLRVEEYGASAVVPRGWQYQRFDEAVLTQSPSKGAGLILFGAADLSQMQTELIRLGTTLRLLTGAQSGDERDLVIHGAHFVVVAYPQSRISSHGADVRIGIAHLRGEALRTFVSYGLTGETEEAERLKLATESILIE